MSDCVFCKIVKKEIPSTVVYEDDQLIVFHDLNPVAPVHVLVVPKRHIEDMNDFANEDQSGELAAHMTRVIPLIAERLGVRQSGYRLISNCGPDAGQTVFHFHTHLLGGVSMGEKLL